MKKLTLVCLILTLAGGVFWLECQQLARAIEGRGQARVEWEQIDRRVAEVEVDLARLESELASREESLQRHRARAAAEADGLRRAAVTNAFGPPDGAPRWSENEAFVWLEKRHLSALGVKPFRDSVSEDLEESADAAYVIREVSRQFSDRFPDFRSFSSLSPEEARTARTAYTRMLAEAAADLDEKQRQAVEAAIRKAETDPLPGAMDQPPAEYRLTQDAAALLAMTTAESEAVDRTTREMIERYHELERRHVSVSEDHAREVSGSPQSLASFKVTTFPSEGSALRAEWVAQINAALGADRAQYLLQLAASWIQSDLGAFGEAERTITFREGEGSAGFSDKNSHGYSYGLGTGGPAPIPPGWRHLIVRPPEGGLPGLRF